MKPNEVMLTLTSTTIAQQIIDKRIDGEDAQSIYTNFTADFVSKNNINLHIFPPYLRS